MSRRSASVLVAIVAVLAACSSAGGTTDGVADAAHGGELFAAHCAACHGEAGAGTSVGPPLVDEAYAPPQQAVFQSAVQQGASTARWGTGPMAAVPGIDAEDVEDIVAYVRGLQQDAGLGE
jgi:mono/diheme cytochrome c family protein